MNQTSSSLKSKLRLGGWHLLLASCWTVLIAGFASWDYREAFSTKYALAESAANEAFKKDLLYRQWASEQGGVYVPISDGILPNPYMVHVPERDITTPTGKRLTLMNPSQVSREMHEMQNKGAEIFEHITSLNPLRPENGPDAWEKRALQSFKAGKKEACALDEIDGNRYFRLMRPIPAMQSCLKCHEDQESRLGEHRGGISISVPWSPFQKAIDSERLIVMISYGVIWAVGLIGLAFFLYRIRTHLKNLERTRTSLEEREHLQQTLMANLPVGIIIVDPKTRKIEAVSAHAEKLFGQAKENILGHRCHKFVCPTDEKACPVCDLGMQIDNTERVLLRADGSRLPILKTVKRIKLNSEEKLLEAFVDIAPLKKAEEAMRESEARYQTLFEKSPDAFILMEKGVFMECNDAAISMLSMTREQLLGRSPLEFSPKRQPNGELSAELFAEKSKEVQETGVAHFDWIYRRPDEKDGWLDISLSTLPSLEHQIVLVTCHDITERMHMEESLRVKSAFLSGLLLSMPDIVFFKNIQGEYLGCNPEFAMWVNRDMPSIIGKTNYDIFSKEEADFYHRFDEITMREGKPCRNEEWVRYSDGRQVLLEMLKAPLKDMTGRVIGILGIGRDITARKHAEKAMQESENKYRGLFEHSHDAIMTLEPPSWKYTTANPATLKMFKANDLEDFLAYGPVLLSPERQTDGRNSSEKASEIIETAMREGYRCFEWTHKRLDGEEFAAMVTLSRMNVGGKQYLQATVRDISEIKQAERWLEQTRWNYETFFNRINDFLFVLDENGNIIHTNAKVNYRLGYTEEELIGQSVLKVHPLERHAEAKRILGEMLEGETDVCTVPLLTKCGEQIPVETSVSMGFWNGRSAVFGVSKDISQIKLSEEMFSKAFHLNSVMMSLSRLADGTFIDANETFISATGYSRDELIGARATDLGLYADASQRDAVVKHLKQHGSIKEAEVAVRTKDGSIKDCLISAATTYVGKDICMLAVVVDVTNRKEMDRRQNLTTDVLAILNDQSEMKDTIGRVLTAIQRTTGFDAVGIRLRDRMDCPFYSQSGFSRDFLQTENSLLVRDEAHRCEAEPTDLPLACTCGLVLSGKADHDKPYFSQGGSFWTNDSATLLEIPPDQDPRLKPRNRCIRDGYCSMAIIPIRTTSEIIGLLQINDRRKDLFTPDKIRFFEGIASSIGVALERKQAEDALRESEEKIRALVENAFDVIFTLDAEGTFLFLSPAWERHFGYPAAEILGKPFSNVVHSDDIASCKASLQRVLTTGQDETCAPYRVLHANGGWRWFEANGTRFYNANGEAQFIGVARDITLQKQATDALRESEEKFRNYIENTFDIIFTLDAQGIVKFASPAWERHTGHPIERIQDKPFSEIVHPDDVGLIVESIRRGLETRRNQTTPPYRVKLADGTWRWFEAGGSAYEDANGEIRFIAIARDITERRQTEEQLREYADVLEANNRALEEFNRLTSAATRAKSEFLANMSHEIRTPMTAILGCADLLLKAKKSENISPDQHVNLETIKRNGEHLLGVINDILDLSKIEAGKMKIEATRCSPPQVVEEVLSLMRIRTAAKQLDLTADLNEPLPETVLTDPLRLRQVLINLIGNAIKFTDRGEIRIAARMSEADGKPRLRFDVSDTGIGMDEEQVGKLFKAFSQVDTSATRKFSGTGLGLCICRRLSEAMGGGIEVRSTPGKGSTFTFTVDPGPLNGVRMIRNDEMSKKETIMKSATEEKFDLQRCKILLAEDGPDNQRLISLILQDAGAAVTAVGNGQLAIQAALEADEAGQTFQVILMDMQMPVMDGYTATRELRSRGYLSPIIALTAHAMSEDRQKCLDAGCDDFATKPVDWQNLLRTVARWAAKTTATARENASESPAVDNQGRLLSLRSQFADHPVISRILPEFLGCLDARTCAMQDAFAAGQLEELRRLAHQLKGAGGSYGFPTISEAAKSLETAAGEGNAEQAGMALKKVAELCRAAVCGMDASPQAPTAAQSSG